jgi:flavin-dependent dehydrogenase
VDPDYDSVIVGAGPAGAAMAALLARAGWKTLLIDAAEFPRAKVCGECLGAAAWPVLCELGIKQEVQDAAAVQQRLKISLPHGRSLELGIPLEGPQSILGISRHRLDWLLLKQAQSCGADVLLAQRVRRVVCDGRSVTGVEVAGKTLRSRVLIAADGRGSSIVKQTGRVVACGPRLVGFKSHCQAAARPCDLTSGTIEMISLAGGYVGLCEVERRELNICGLLPRQLVQQARGSIEQALARLLPGRSIGSPEHWLTMPDVRQQTATPQLEGVLYVGDAMGTIEPLAGQGMAMALQSASLAAEMLLEQPQPGCDRALQHRYQAAWRRTFHRTIVRARRFGWLLRHPALLGSLVNVAPHPPRLEELLLRTCYRTTRLPVTSRGRQQTATHAVP